MAKDEPPDAINEHPKASTLRLMLSQNIADYQLQDTNEQQLMHILHQISTEPMSRVKPILEEHIGVLGTTSDRAKHVFENVELCFWLSRLFCFQNFQHFMPLSFRKLSNWRAFTNHVSINIMNPLSCKLTLSKPNSSFANMFKSQSHFSNVYAPNTILVN